MHWKNFFKNPYFFYARKGRYYPTFWGEAHTHPRLKIIHGEKMSKQILFYDQGMSYYILDRQELESCQEKLFKKLISNPQLVKKFILITQKNLLKGVNLLTGSIPKLTKLSDKQFAKLVRDFEKIMLEIQIYADSTYYLSERIANNKLKEKISQLVDEKQAVEVTQALSAMEEPSFMECEKNELAKIALKGDGKLLKKHVEKWQHFKFDYWGPVVSFNEFEQRYFQFRKNLDEAREFVANFKNYQARVARVKLELIKQYKLKKDIIDLANLVSYLGQLNDVKKGSLTKLTYLFDKVLEELAKRRNIPKIWIHHLVKAEVDKLAVGKLKLTESLMTARMTRSMLIVANGKCQKCLVPIDDEIVNETWQFIEEQMNAKKTDNSFKGQGVYNAIYEGEVVIMYSHEDLKKAKKGMVLVAPKTTVDFVAILNQAGAVVTDYGGLTSHPAIIARELKIPGVVGTNIATQVLNDGDIVRVDGGKGIVKIIKRVVN